MPRLAPSLHDALGIIAPLQSDVKGGKFRLLGLDGVGRGWRSKLGLGFGLQPSPPLTETGVDQEDSFSRSSIIRSNRLNSFSQLSPSSGGCGVGVGVGVGVGTGAGVGGGVGGGAGGSSSTAWS